MEIATHSPLLELLNGFIVELRSAGLPVSLTENLDAVEAVKHIPIEDRETFKYALAGTLVKNHSHWKAFETVFEVYFSLRGAEGQVSGQGGSQEGLTQEQLAEMLFQALAKQDRNLMRTVARQSVQRFAGMEPGRPVGGTYYLYRTLRNLNLEEVLDRLLTSSADSDSESDFLEERLSPILILFFYPYDCVALKYFSLKVLINIFSDITHSIRKTPFVIIPGRNFSHIISYNIC